MIKINTGERKSLMSVSNFVRVLLSRRSVKRVLNEILNSDENTKGVVLNRKAIYLLPIVILLCLFSLFLLFDRISQKAIIEVVAVSIFMFLLVLLIIACVIYYYNCRIYYKEQTFTVSTFFGKKRTYHYEDIETVIQGSQVWAFFLKNGKFRLSIAMSGCHSFLAHAKKKKNFPVLPKRTKDIFNNNIKKPDSFIALYILTISLFAIGIILASIFAFPKDHSSLQEETIFFENYKIIPKSFSNISNDLIFYSSTQPDPYRIYGYDKKIKDINALINEFDSCSEFAVTCVKKTDYYEIITITSNISDKEFVSVESTYQYNLHRYVSMLIFLGSLLLGLIIMYGIALHVGRNAHRYSRCVVRLFFKEDVINVKRDRLQD